MEKSILVWPKYLRIWHWTLAGLLLSNVFLNEPGAVLHRSIGVILLGLVIVRCVWGLGRHPYLSFAEFFPTRQGISELLRALAKGQHPYYLGHNPLGATMIFVLLFWITLIICAGMLTQTELFLNAQWLKECHGLMAYGLMGLASIHVLAVVITDKLFKHHLIKSMLTGRKPSELNDE